MDTHLAPLLLHTDAGVIGGLQRTAGAYHQEGGAPLIVLLHGAGGGARSLVKLGQSLQIQGSLLIPDLNGYGRTQLGSEVVCNQNAVAQHRLVIDSLLAAYCQPGQVVIIIGHSMGGFLGLLTALSDKWPIAAIVAIEPVAFSVLDPEKDADARAEDLDKVLALDAALRNGEPEPALAQFISYWNNVEWTVLPDSMREALLQQAVQIGADTLAVARDGTPPELYRRLTLPVLLLQGRASPRPAVAVVQRLQELLPAVEFKIIDEVGHMGVIQQPHLFTPLINDFLTQCVGK